MTTISFSGVEGNRFDGDKTLNGNLILLNGADRAIYIAAAAAATAGDDLSLYAGDGTGTGNRNGGNFYLHGGDAANSGTDGNVILGFVNGGAARGLVLVGADAYYGSADGQVMQINKSANFGGLSLNTWSATVAQGPLLEFQRSKSATIGTYTAVESGDVLGIVAFRGADGNSFATAAHIYGEVDGTVADGQMPGRLAFETSAAGSGSPTRRMTLNSSGVLLINATSAYADNGQLLEVNKSADDGGIGLFCWSATDAERPLLEFHKSASATIGTKALVANDEALGGIVWRAADSATGWSTAASIEGYIDAAPGDNDTGGRLVFGTTADGESTPTARMTLDSSGNLTMAGSGGSGIIQFFSSAYSIVANNAMLQLKGSAGIALSAGATELARITTAGLSLTGGAATAKLHLKAGAAAASSAPLKFATGPLLTTPEAGAVEHLGDGFYVTPTTTVARQQVATGSNAVFYEGEIVSWEDDLVLAA